MKSKKFVTFTKKSSYESTLKINIIIKLGAIVFVQENTDVLYTVYVI